MFSISLSRYPEYTNLFFLHLKHRTQIKSMKNVINSPFKEGACEATGGRPSLPIQFEVVVLFLNHSPVMA